MSKNYFKYFRRGENQNFTTTLSKSTPLILTFFSQVRLILGQLISGQDNDIFFIFHYYLFTP